MKYEGDWVNDMRNGQGNLFSPENFTYEGEWF